MSKLVRFDLDLYYAYGGMYEVLTDDEYQKVLDSIGKELYFGEISGKHSEVICELEPILIEIITEDQEKIDTFIELTGGHIGAFSLINVITEQ